MGAAQLVETMATKELSPREEQIVGLCTDGLTNEAIAHQLGLSVGTINTYWLRIRLKVGGLGRTDSVVKVIKDRAERALRSANVERTNIADIIAEKERAVVELRAALALLHLAMSEIRSTVWATDKELRIQIIAGGELPSTHVGIKWEVGKTVYEIFKSKDPADPAVAAHRLALAGTESQVRLEGEFANMLLRVMPLADEAGDVMGCVSILHVSGG